MTCSTTLASVPRDGCAHPRPRRGDEPCGAVLQRRRGARLQQVHGPHPRDRRGAAVCARGARSGARPIARGVHQGRPHLRPRSRHAQPLHARRHDRQQLVRGPLDHLRPHPGEHRRAGESRSSTAQCFAYGATSDAELAAIIAAGGRRGEIYQRLRDLRDRYAALVRAPGSRISRAASPASTSKS
jgi:hypothetical protein